MRPGIHSWNMLCKVMLHAHTTLQHRWWLFIAETCHVRWFTLYHSHYTGMIWLEEAMDKISQSTAHWSDTWWHQCFVWTFQHCYGMVFTCRGSCEQRFVALTAKFVVTLHDGGHVGEGRGGREEGELQRIQHPPQHSCPIDKEISRNCQMQAALHMLLRSIVSNLPPVLMTLVDSLDSLHCPQLLKVADNSCVRGLVPLPVHILKRTVVEDERQFCIQWQHMNLVSFPEIGSWTKIISLIPRVATTKVSGWLSMTTSDLFTHAQNWPFLLREL